MTKAFLSLALILFSPLSCAGENCEALSAKTCGVLKNFTVADKSHELKFDHLCSELDNHNRHYQSAYAFFEPSAPGAKYKALALAEVSVGWMGYHPEAKPPSSDSEVSPEAKGLALSLERMQIQSLKEWAGAPFSLALQIKNNKTGQTAAGEFSKTFSYSYAGSGYPKDINYAISPGGDLFWEQLKEPEDESQTEAGFCDSCETGSKSERRNEYKISSAIHISSPKIARPEDPHSLFLLMKNEKTGAIIPLQGPVVKNLKELLAIKYSGPRVLTWEVLDPWQEGGLWDVIFDAFRYGDCIYLRKQSKKEFARRWN